MPRLCPDAWYPLDAIEDNVLVRLKDWYADAFVYAEDALEEAVDGWRRARND